MAIRTRLVEYTHEGTTLEGFLAWDDAIAGKRPAVAVAHAWAGRTAFECEKARQLAMLGYVGFAVDLYGKGVLGQSKEENAKLMTPFIENRAKLQGRIAQAIETAGADDVILLAGKGHEPYQEIAGVRHPFSDQQEAEAALARWRERNLFPELP